ncbi:MULTISPECIES: DUF3122 domain-containing protein [Limnospira]|uniref:DUF3122 domain-containing protein n=1 Tax=Limnospira fusiformis PMC 851.14 TaxID=2219512 RepID=A0ABU9EMM9_LIMFS|nr:DUF3122 domain-containing protein [Limnospira sp. PMC 917.15]MDT9233096.1 DUF3122 domain-containing protein [Limnospira sp. PMC 917.15]MDY7053186.1 DUF3122 domain-containing protein [Limnospira fusiformis LS22]
MLELMLINVRKLVSILLLIILPLLLVMVSPETAIALIQQQEEAPGQILYKSRHSLRDHQGNSWQVILFKRVKNGEVKDVSLRLVGFPGSVTFNHPEPLQIVFSNGRILEAVDEFGQKAPGPNVGQYDLTDILPKISQADQIELNLSIAQTKSAIAVPSPVVLEWKAINSPG